MIASGLTKIIEPAVPPVIAPPIDAPLPRVSILSYRAFFVGTSSEPFHHAQ